MSSDSEEEIVYTVFQIKSDWFKEDGCKSFNGQKCYSEYYIYYDKHDDMYVTYIYLNDNKEYRTWKFEISKKALNIINEEIYYETALYKCIGN